MTTARFYQEDRNPGEAALSGVPLGDIDEETWARLPPWVQASVDNWTNADGLKVYLMTHRKPPEPEASDEPQTEVKPKSRKAVAVDAPVEVVDEPPADETPPAEMEEVPNDSQ